jgi:alkaline phosphatase
MTRFICPGTRTGTVARLLGALLTAALASAANSAPEGYSSPALSPLPEYQRKSPWYREAQQRVAGNRQRLPATGTARNVILFVGDGMGMSTVTAARIYAGQLTGASGEEHNLSFESFPYTGLARTYNVDAQTPDSAGTMNAMVTGVKTNIGVFGVDEAVSRGDCASGEGRELLSLLSLAELAGKRTGVVSTARLTHATPAATYAASVEREWEDDSGMPEAARALGCEDIAAQLISHRDRLNARYGAGASDGIEVAMGGGRRHFLPRGAGGRRKDGQDLVRRWQSLYPHGSYAETLDDLAGVNEAPLLGLFANSHMGYALQRATAGNTQPSLVAMTDKAIELLAGGEGYFLVVEAGRIDHAHHAGNAANALNETVEMSRAVAAAMAKVDLKDTLIIVTADHSHVFTMAGYPRRGNPILGKVVLVGSDEPALDADGQPYTTLGYMNGRGFRDYGDERDAERTYRDPPATGRRDISTIDTTAPGYHQEALIPTLNSSADGVSETHGGEDVPVYASGPGAHSATGSYEQNLLFHVMLQASDWEREAMRRLAALED